MLAYLIGVLAFQYAKGMPWFFVFWQHSFLQV